LVKRPIATKASGYHPYSKRGESIHGEKMREKKEKRMTYQEASEWGIQNDHPTLKGCSPFWCPKFPKAQNGKQAKARTNAGPRVLIAEPPIKLHRVDTLKGDIEEQTENRIRKESFEDTSSQRQKDHCSSHITSPRNQFLRKGGPKEGKNIKEREARGADRRGSRARGNLCPEPKTSS